MTKKTLFIIILIELIICVSVLCMCYNSYRLIDKVEDIQIEMDSIQREVIVTNEYLYD